MLMFARKTVSEVRQEQAEKDAVLAMAKTLAATKTEEAAKTVGAEFDKEKNTLAFAMGAGGKADAFSSERISLTELWPAYLRKQLTVEALRSGLQGGLWVLDANLDVDFPWQANDAILIFRNGAALNTFAKEGKIKLTDCRLEDAVLDFQGACEVTLERCNWQGDYAPVLKRTALNLNGQALTVTDCQFSTRDARAISVQKNILYLTGSRFTRCGHAEMSGGAVWHSDHPRAIENCRFDRCLASLGGALYVNALYGVNKCEFVACESRALQSKCADDVAVYAVMVTSPTAVSNCCFRQTSLVIGSTSFRIDTGFGFVCSTWFQQADVYFHSNIFSMKIVTSSCSFDDGETIEENLA